MPRDAWYDIDWELLSRYAAGECTPAEQAQVEAWLTAAPARRELLEAVRRGAEATPEPPVADLKARVLATTGISQPVAAPRRPDFGWSRRSPWHTAFRAAAVVAIVAGGYLASRYAERKQSAVPAMPTAHQIATGLGERRSLRFGDGTEVTLGPGSTLRWQSDYGQHDRQVILDGEAVFTVVHDSTRPFAVRTSRLLARDVGTRFVVRDYPRSGASDVVVADGAVMVNGTPAGQGSRADSVVLGHGQRARIGADGRMTLARDVALPPYFDWTEGRLIFQNTPLREVVERIGRWYNVEVRLEAPQLAEEPVTASFGPEPAPRALEFIAVATGLTVQRHGSAFVLQSK